MPPSDLDQASTCMSVRWVRAGHVGIALRKATTEDAPFLLHLHVTARLAAFGRIGWSQAHVTDLLNEQARIQLAAYRQQYPDAEWLVIVDGTAPIGRLLLDFRADEIALVDIIIEQACRSLGLGSAVIADILDAADRRGHRVTLHVDQDNRARALYGRLGFRPAGDRGLYEVMLYEGATSTR